MKKSGGINLLFVAALALIILAGTGAAVSLSNSGGGTWKYQREISVKENSGTTLTDYQVLIELKGVDFPSEAKSDGADVRFTDFSGNELNYWIESWDYAGKNAKVWVKVPSIPSGSITVVHMHYGNPGAGVISDGDKVFDFFDDFGKTSLDSTKWINNGHIISISNGVLDISGPASGEARLVSISTFIDGIFEGRIKQTSGNEMSQLVRSSSNAAGQTYLLRMSGWDNPNTVTFYKWTNSWKLLSSEPYNLPDWGFFHIQSFYFSGSSLMGSIDRGTKTSVVTDNSYSSGSIGFRVIYYRINVDWALVRKYASPEPTVSLAQPKSSSLSITKSAFPYSLRQFQESTIKVLIENSGTSEVKAIEIMDSIHPSFDLTGGDFPNPKKFDTIRAGESRELQYTIRSKESGAFTLDPATVTYADSEGNIQEVKSEPVSIKVIPSSDGGGSGTNTGQNSKSASVSLHGEKTDVVMGEDILLRLSAVNLITKPRMHVQVIIIPPSGMSVTSSEFSKSAAGQFTANYQLEPGDGKDIEVRIRSNQIGDFNVNGRIIYYFGDDKDKSEDQTLNLPIKVRKEIASTQEAAGKSTPGFEGVIGISGLLIVMGLLKRGGLSK